MKNNKYWNTIWLDRDAEFYWSGVKTGFIFTAVSVSALWVIGISLFQDIKYLKNKKSLN